MVNRSRLWGPHRQHRSGLVAPRAKSFWPCVPQCQNDLTLGHSGTVLVALRRSGPVPRWPCGTPGQLRVGLAALRDSSALAFWRLGPSSVLASRRSGPESRRPRGAHAPKPPPRNACNTQATPLRCPAEPVPAAGRDHRKFPDISVTCRKSAGQKPRHAGNFAQGYCVREPDRLISGWSGVVAQACSHKRGLPWGNAGVNNEQA
jgi:hypothetical protein